MIRRVLVGENGGFVRRHLVGRVAKLVQKALEGKLGARDARAGHLRALACLAMALIAADLR